MSFFLTPGNVTIKGGSFTTIGGDHNTHINVQRDDPVQRWRTCIEIFDIVDSGNHYGIDYEIIRVKLEVERIRLLEWGNAVGFGTTDQSPSKLDSRLDRNELRGAVLSLLGCIYHVFEEAERLQERYGLRPAIPHHENDELRPLPLASIFKRAYEPLLRLSKDRQRNVPLQKRRIWAIRDKKKFQEMISEIKGFNDSLDQLFPDIKKFTSENMKNEIDCSEDVKALHSLQEATTDEHDDISEIAGDRLEEMGATVTAKSQIGEDIGRRSTALPPVTTNVESVDEEDPDGQEARDMVAAVESFVDKKHEGRLRLSLMNITRYRARVHWDGQHQRSELSFWNNREKGFLKCLHTSFNLYHKKTYIKGSRQDKYEHSTDESYVLLDVESHSEHQNVNPGTVTVEGFGIECWSYDINFGKPRESTIFVSCEELPSISASQLLRRNDELSHGAQKFGWNPKQEKADLKEFFGKAIGHYDYGQDETFQLQLSNFFNLLNRRDIFADFVSTSSIGMTWLVPNEGIGTWNFLWQIILAKELALRLEVGQGGSHSGFTHRVLAALIVQDLWFRNIGIRLTDAKIPPEQLVAPLERTKAEAFKEKGNEAMKNGQWQKAVDFYTEALQLDRNHATYFSNRSAAFLSLEKFKEARIDAYTATQLDPKYAKAWSRLGLAEIKLGNGSAAQHAYECAIQVAGTDCTTLMKQGLVDAKAKLMADVKAIKEEKDEETKDLLRKKLLDEDWDISLKSMEVHSRVHQQQVEGLLLFAERMGWPYINETRDYAEDVYGNLRSGQSVSSHLHDWLFGMMLPGKWMSFKIMAALVLCTPSISANLKVAKYFDCGLSLPKKSYWRVRTVLGRVLGCLPNVLSLCGWIGPCLTRVEFIPPLSEEAKKKPRYIHLNARTFSPITGGLDDFQSSYSHNDAVRLQPEEDLPDWLVEIKDNGKWVCPQPPLREFITCTIESIRLKKLPPDINIATKRGLGDEEAETEAKYRASIVFSMDNNEDLVTYTLYTNPIFVTVPPCHFGPHQVHLRELSRYQKDVWMVDRLKNHTPEDFDDDDVMIINATGKGTEVLARAWCAERGKNAVIRRAGGPCFVCAVRTAGKEGLSVGVLIWVA